ncbi:ATP-grasp fold amidoligase family protein [Ornithinibacillus sp. 179-J 7C1 HS]|uniref:ATP-grasp fold amidoligase family protein n=1 Tax=Ornithinibacillus sp. 179-J 7C1 HS TaxID=3142384 RepID=UPI00399F8830
MDKRKLFVQFPRLYNLYSALQFSKRYLKNMYYKSLNEKKYPTVLAKMYKKRMGQDLDWNNLTTYNEKMQWVKLYDNDPLKAVLTDKYQVRDWIKNTIGEQYLIPLLGVWDNFDEIDFELLPQQFVLKTNNACGTNLIVKDKNKLDRIKAKKQFNRWMKINFAFVGFEMHYKDIKPKIIAETFMEDSNGELKDFKFLCFNGEVHYCWVDIDRFNDRRRNVYNLNWELQEWTQHQFKNTDFPVPKPNNFELMVDLAKKLCQGFTHVRVDFYNVDGKIYFGEMTFTSGSGFVKITPEQYSVILGQMWKLPINE